MANDSVLQVENISVLYQDHPIIKGVYLNFKPNHVTGIMGRSGCGKSTLMRCFNRLNDLNNEMSVKGNVWLNGENIYNLNYDLIKLRRQIGMVFQKPAPFPTTIYQNIAIGLKANGYRQNPDDLIEEVLMKVGLWNDVKNRLHKSALNLSGGQQQKLCIARAIAIQPDILLLDEPCSALDPISTLEIENLISNLKQNYTIILTTHDLKQIARVCDEVVYMSLKENEQGQKTGFVVETDTVENIFLKPKNDDTLAYTTYFSTTR